MVNQADRIYQSTEVTGLSQRGDIGILSTRSGCLALETRTSISGFL